ncbi:hypothetical protein ACSBR1_040401 [Camellia fascicularis]
MAPKPKEKPKPSQSQASKPAIAVEDLFTTLNRYIQRSEYEQAAKVADQVLSIVSNDEDVIRCKIVALIKADRIDEALSTIESSRRLPIDFSFFKAYCFYRQNKLNEALASLEGQEGSSAAMLLQSQILFRLGKLHASLDIYQKLQKSKIESLEINLIAGLLSAGWASEVQEVMKALRVKATSSFELAYNTACSLIERKKYSDAEQLLLSARRIGQETLMEDNLADDDIEVELAPITVQLAHVQQLLGHTQEAIEAYTDIIKRNLADESSLAVASNNLVSLKGPKDVSDSLRKLDRLTEKGSGPQIFQLAHGLDLKLSPKQREAIYANRVLLLLHSNRIDQARELVAALPDMFPYSVMPVLLQAAVLRSSPTSRRSFSLQGRKLLLVLATLKLQPSPSQRYRIFNMPATIATLISLKERAGDIDSAIAVFDSAIQWWSNAMAEDNKLNVIMQEASSFKLKHGRKEEAARLFEELVRSHGSIEALLGLIKTAAHSDIDKAKAYEKQLKPLPGLKSVDVDSLEKTSGAKHVESVLHVGITEQFEVKGKEKAKKKRKRKPKYQKGSILQTQGAVAKEAVNANAKSNQTTNAKAASSQNAVAEQSKPSSKSSRKKSRN